MSNKKKYYGVQNVSNFLPEEAKKILKSRGFFEVELLKNWENLIGKKYSALTMPLKLKSSKNRDSKSGSVLVLKVDPSIGFAVQHDIKKIISKLNGFFGYAAISKIDLIQERIQKDNLKKANNINLLIDKVKSKSKSFDELIEYPELKRKFEKIASKILKN